MSFQLKVKKKKTISVLPISENIFAKISVDSDDPTSIYQKAFKKGKNAWEKKWVTLPQSSPCLKLNRKYICKFATLSRWVFFSAAAKWENILKKYLLSKSAVALTSQEIIQPVLQINYIFSLLFFLLGGWEIGAIYTTIESEQPLSVSSSFVHGLSTSTQPLNALESIVRSTAASGFSSRQTRLLEESRWLCALNGSGNSVSGHSHTLQSRKRHIPSSGQNGQSHHNLTCKLKTRGG